MSIGDFVGDKVSVTQYEVKERGVVFSPEQTPGVLEGAITVTRRAWGLEEINKNPDKWELLGETLTRGYWRFERKGRFPEYKIVKCPYGIVGDRLWLKETHTFLVHPDLHDDSVVSYYVAYEDGTYKELVGFPKPVEAHGFFSPENWRWRSPRYMFRWASRKDLEITGVRAERLQDITVGDLRDEGWDPQLSPLFKGVPLECRPRVWYAQLWDSHNARYPWVGNYWVWPISFKLV